MPADCGVWDRETFDQRYARDDWASYRPLFSYCVRFALPGPMLDIGAGLGFFVECCQRWSVRCVGLEGSEYAVAQARARGLDIRHFLLTEDCRLPFSDDEFSVAVMSQVLPFLPLVVAQRTLAESHRVLQPDGIIVVTSVGKHFPGRPETGHQRFYTANELRRELESAGFAILLDLNEPRRLLGSGVWGRGVMRALYRAARWDFLSESSGFVAQKTGGSGPPS